MPRTAPTGIRSPAPQVVTVAGVPVTPIGLVIAAAALRGVAVALSGVIALAGLAVLVWSLTPASGTEAGPALRAGVAAFAAANLMPVSIGGVALTLPPLLCTGFLVLLLVTTAHRGRFQPEGRYQELLAIGTTAAVYGLVVAATVRGFGPPDAVPAATVWTAPVLALVAVTAGTLVRGSAWRAFGLLMMPAWARVAGRGAAAGAAAMIAGGALAVCVGLLTDFGAAVAVSALAAPTWVDGLGLAALGAVYVPNAVVAGVGYVSGTGFEVGPATYSPFGVSPVDLPALPLLAAAPDGPAPSMFSVVALVVPVLAGLVVARVVIRGVLPRRARLAAAAGAAVVAGAALGLLALIGGGGVGDGRWASFGAPPLLLAGVVTAELMIVTLSAVVIAGLRAARRHRATDTGYVESPGVDTPLADPADPDAETAATTPPDPDPVVESPDVEPPPVDPAVPNAETAATAPPDPDPVVENPDVEPPPVDPAVGNAETAATAPPDPDPVVESPGVDAPPADPVDPDAETVEPAAELPGGSDRR